MTAFVAMVVGLVLLVAGAELLVRGAAQLATRLGLRPLVIGLTVVAFGTSAPELAVSVGSSLNGQAELALGNVVGSNIFNVLFILGASALIAPLIVSAELVRRDVPLMIGASLLVVALAANGVLGRAEGLLLLAVLVAFTIMQFRLGRQSENEDVGGLSARPAGRLWRNLLEIMGGLVLLVIGAQLLLDGAVTLAQALGVSELVIGLTIVAAGTSLPELATSVLASFRGQRDIAVGNVVGSNLFNLLGVLGAAVVIAPEPLQLARQMLLFDLPVMLAVAVACLPIFFTGHLISRAEGGAFVGFYVAYSVYLVLLATANPILPLFQAGLAFFVLPLTGLTLAIALLRHFRAEP